MKKKILARERDFGLGTFWFLKIVSPKFIFRGLSTETLWFKKLFFLKRLEYIYKFIAGNEFRWVEKHTIFHKWI